MIEILHRESEEVILIVEGEWRQHHSGHAYLEGSDLHGVTLDNADLGFANLRGANLSDTDLTEASLLGADFSGADLSRATLRHADCHSAWFRGANLAPADLSYATLQSADWRGANLSGANLSRATMKSGLYDQNTLWPEGFVPDKHHLRYKPSTAKRKRPKAAPATESIEPSGTSSMPKSNTRPKTVDAGETVSAAEGVVIPCSVDEVESHLRAFITAFVLPHLQPRWLEFLIDRRSEWDRHPCTQEGTVSEGRTGRKHSKLPEKRQNILITHLTQPSFSIVCRIRRGYQIPV